AAKSEPHARKLPLVVNILAITLIGGLFLVFFVGLASLLLGSLVRGLIVIHVLPKGADRRGILRKLILFEPGGSSRGVSAEPAWASSSSSSSDSFSGGGGLSGGGGASGSW